MQHLPVTPAHVTEVLAYAKRLSGLNECAYHVNATVRMVQGVPVVVALNVSDWFSAGSTIATFVRGQES